jgi:hypothetical protein
MVQRPAPNPTKDPSETGRNRIRVPPGCCRCLALATAPKPPAASHTPSASRIVDPVRNHIESGLNTTLTTLPRESVTIPQSESNFPSSEWRKTRALRATKSPDAAVREEGRALICGMR